MSRRSGPLRESPRWHRSTTLCLGQHTISKWMMKTENLGTPTTRARGKVRKRDCEPTTNLSGWQPDVHGILNSSGLNKAKMSPEKWDALWEKGMRHLLLAIQLYRIQSDTGRYFLNEHQSSANSWKVPEMRSLMADLGLSKITAHVQIRHGEYR